MKIVLQDKVWEGEKIKGSRFIGHILHVDTLESVNKLENTSRASPIFTCLLCLDFKRRRRKIL